MFPWKRQPFSTCFKVKMTFFGNYLIWAQLKENEKTSEQQIPMLHLPQHPPQPYPCSVPSFANTRYPPIPPKKKRMRGSFVTTLTFAVDLSLERPWGRRNQFKFNLSPRPWCHCGWSATLTNKNLIFHPSECVNIII